MNIEQMAREAGMEITEADAEFGGWLAVAPDGNALARFAALVRDHWLDKAAEACDGIKVGHDKGGEYQTDEGALRAKAAILALKECTQP